MLKNKKLWDYFLAISNIPRTSGNEQAISNYLAKFFKDHGCAIKQDKHWNLYVSKAASKGYEKIAPVCFQAHLDMVGAKVANSSHNFKTDPIKVSVDQEGWASADGTSLGGDDGAGVCVLMDLFANVTKHGYMEAAFTVQEETSMVGAEELSFPFKAKYLVNLDNEAPAISDVCVGCCGGAGYEVTSKLASEKLRTGSQLYELELLGAQGGHSGVDIHENRINAVIEAAYLVYVALENPNVQLVSFHGGEAQNSLPTSAKAVLVLPTKDVKTITSAIKAAFKHLQDGFKLYEPNLKLRFVTNKQKVEHGISNQAAIQAVSAIAFYQQGITNFDVNYRVPYISSNIGIAKIENHELYLSILYRAANEANLKWYTNKKQAWFKMFNAQLKLTDKFAPWFPEPNGSTVLKDQIKNLIKQKFNLETNYFVTAGGLEVGIICSKNKNFVEGISLSYHVLNSHSTKEKLQVDSLDHLSEMCQQIVTNIK